MHPWVQQSERNPLWKGWAQIGAGLSTAVEVSPSHPTHPFLGTTRALSRPLCNCCTLQATAPSGFKQALICGACEGGPKERAAQREPRTQTFMATKAKSHLLTVVNRLADSTRCAISTDFTTGRAFHLSIELRPADGACSAIVLI